MLVLCDGSKCSLEDVEAFVKLLVANHQGHKNAHYVVVSPRSDGDEAVLVTITGDFLRFRIRWFTCCCVADKLDGAHATEAADIANQIPFPLPPAGTFFKSLPDGGGTREQIFFLNRFDRREGGNARERISGKGAAKRSGFRGIHNFRASGNGGEGQSAAERFCHGDEIRLDAEMLGSEPFSGARDAGLHFVGDEHNAVL